MFPTAHSTIYRNEAGEPLGWSDESSYEPDPYDDNEAGEQQDESDPPPHPECCAQGDAFADYPTEPAPHTPEHQLRRVWICEYCGHPMPATFQQANPITEDE